jgi:DNA-directed RNA polymerase beta' subunit
MLPFWYSIPFITALIGFFKSLKKKKSEKEAWEAEKQGMEKDTPDAGRDREDQGAARELATDLTPQGYTIDNYLKELKDNWSKLIDKNNKDDFIADVNALIRDRMREIMKVQKYDRMTSSLLNQLSTDIINENKALKGLNDRESLYHYVRLYILKLIIMKKI